MRGQKQDGRKSPRQASAAGFTLPELMVAVAITGVLTSVAVPAYKRNVRKSRTAEATINLRRLHDGARAYYMEQGVGRASFVELGGQFPATPDPDIVPQKGSCCDQPGWKCSPDPNLWTGETWQVLNFAVTDPHYFSYKYENESVGTALEFKVAAYGDLDCDNTYSTFEMKGEVAADGSVNGKVAVWKKNELE